jgi:hypothetical protein
MCCVAAAWIVAAAARRRGGVEPDSCCCAEECSPCEADEDGQPEWHVAEFIKDNADRKVRVARLGGDDGRYWTVPRGMLTVVDKKLLLEAVLTMENFIEVDHTNP